MPQQPASRTVLPRLAPKPKRGPDVIAEHRPQVPEKRRRTVVPGSGGSGGPRVANSRVERASSSTSLNNSNNNTEKNPHSAAPVHVTPPAVNVPAVPDFGDFPLDIAGWPSLETPDYADQPPRGSNEVDDDGYAHDDLMTATGQQPPPYLGLLSDFKPAVVTANFVNNEFVTSKTRQWTLVHDPVSKSCQPRRDGSQPLFFDVSLITNAPT